MSDRIPDRPDPVQKEPGLTPGTNAQDTTPDAAPATKTPKRRFSLRRAVRSASLLAKLLPAAIISILVLLAVLGLFTPLFGGPFVSLNQLLPFHAEKTISSQSVLKEIRDLFTVHTMEYVHKVVFPFDFMDPAVRYDTVLKKLRAARPDQRRLSDVLSPQEIEYYQVLRFARDLGLRAGPDGWDFSVFTVVIKAGYNLEALARPGDDSATQTLTATVSDLQDAQGKPAGKAVSITLPPATVTDTIIEDINRESYPFPDIHLQPDKWKELSVYVANRIRERAIDQRILDASAAQMKQLLTTLMRGAGFEEVKFVDAPK